jgi:hypothetical protein
MGIPFGGLGAQEGQPEADNGRHRAAGQSHDRQRSVRATSPRHFLAVSGTTYLLTQRVSNGLSRSHGASISRLSENLHVEARLGPLGHVIAGVVIVALAIILVVGAALAWRFLFG